MSPPQEPHEGTSTVGTNRLMFRITTVNIYSRSSLRADLTPLQNLIGIFVQFLFSRYTPRQNWSAAKKGQLILKLVRVGLKMALPLFRGGKM